MIIDLRSTFITRDSKSRQVFERLTNDRNVTHRRLGQVGLPRVRCVILGIAAPSFAIARSVGRNIHGPWMRPSPQRKHPTWSFLRFAKSGWGTRLSGRSRFTTAAISRTSSEVENLESTAIDFLKAIVSMLYTLTSFKLVERSRLKKCWSRGPWKRRMVTSSRLGKASNGRSQGNWAVSNRRVRKCGRVAMTARYSALNGDLISRLRSVSLQAEMSPTTPSMVKDPPTTTSNTSRWSQRHLSEAVLKTGRSMLLRCGRTRVKSVIFGDKNERV